jgi:hypothetical protein
VTDVSNEGLAMIILLIVRSYKTRV